MSANLTAADVESLREGYRREHDPAFMELFAPDAGLWSDQRTPCHRRLCPRLQLQRGGPARGAEGRVYGADLRHREFRRGAGRE